MDALHMLEEILDRETDVMPEEKPLLDLWYDLMNMPFDEYKEAARQLEGTPPKKSQSWDFSEPNTALLRDLWGVRSQIAAKEQLAEYLAAPEYVLWIMVRQKPTTMEELAAVPGLWDYIAERYGELYLEVIRRHKEKAKEREREEAGE